MGVHIYILCTWMLSFKSCSLLSPRILFGKLVSILGKRSKTIFKVNFNPNCSMILYIQSHTCCKHRTGCLVRCSSVLASNFSWAQQWTGDDAFRAEPSPCSLQGSCCWLTAPRTSVLHMRWALGLWRKCSFQLLDAAERWEKRKKGLRVYSQVEGASASVLRALVSQVFLFCSPFKMQCADTWKWDVRNQNILLGLGFPFHVLYWYCKQISHSWDNNHDHELHLKLWIYPNGNPQSYLIPKFTFSVGSLSTCQRWLWIQMPEIASLPKVWKGTF